VSGDSLVDLRSTATQGKDSQVVNSHSAHSHGTQVAAQPTDRLGTSVETSVLQAWIAKSHGGGQYAAG